MLVAGLTGGIGSGKSTFAALLGERGAQVIDADALGHLALRPGQPAWHSVVDQFGEEVLTPHTMQIDRKLLADIVFQDRDKLAALNAIVHPVILKAIADDLERLRRTQTVVVLDAALVVETGLDEAADVLIVVVSRRALREERLVRERGMSIADIGARMAAQRHPEELRSRADIVVTNDGTLDDLAREADRVWDELSVLNTAD